MRLAAIVLAFLIAAGAARAGIYNTSQAETVRSVPSGGNVRNFLETFIYVRSIGIDKVDKSNRLRNAYFLSEALAGGRASGALTLEQKLDYSAVLIRRKKFQQAIDYLGPLVRQHSEIFFFESHLAMAYWASGQPGYDRRAVTHLDDALTNWPKTFAKLSKEQQAFVTGPMAWSESDFVFFRKTETYLLDLMRRRLAEPAGKPFEAVDAIFTDGQKPPKAIRFVNDEGAFEPGRLAAAERSKLPADALEIVEQLNLWMPEDARLYWLLGEVANTLWTPEQLTVDKKLPKEQLDAAIEKYRLAIFNINAGSSIFNELVETYLVRAADLRARRRTLGEFKATVKDIDVDSFEGDEKKLVAVVPLSTPPMNPRMIAVIFAAGAAVGIFAIWQFQEIRRRRRAG
jgi:hypothetical protein